MVLVRALLSVFIPVVAVAAENPECQKPYVLHGKVLNLIKPYDKMILDLPKAADANKALNQYLAKSGLPVTVATEEEKETKGYSDFVESDSPGGAVAMIFLKTMRANAKSNVELDLVYEVSEPNATKALRTWQVPYNEGSIVGIEGDELIYQTTLNTICSKSESSRQIAYAIKPDGKFRVINTREDDSKDVEKCKAKDELFKASDYAACKEWPDAKTKKKHILVFEYPMT